jgi:hypothetical protein
VSIPDSDQRVVSDQHVSEPHVGGQLVGGQDSGGQHSGGQHAGGQHAGGQDGEHVVSLDEASRQLEQAVHDAQVAYDCIALGNLDRAHTNAITARAAVDAAEAMLRAAVGGADVSFHPGPQGAVDAEPDAAFEAFGPGEDETFDTGTPETR